MEPDLLDIQYLSIKSVQKVNAQFFRVSTNTVLTLYCTCTGRGYGKRGGGENTLDNHAALYIYILNIFRPISKKGY